MALVTTKIVESKIVYSEYKTSRTLCFALRPNANATSRNTLRLRELGCVGADEVHSLEPTVFATSYKTQLFLEHDIGGYSFFLTDTFL